MSLWLSLHALEQGTVLHSFFNSRKCGERCGDEVLSEALGDSGHPSPQHRVEQNRLTVKNVLVAKADEHQDRRRLGSHKSARTSWRRLLRGWAGNCQIRKHRERQKEIQEVHDQTQRTRRGPVLRVGVQSERNRPQGGLRGEFSAWAPLGPPLRS